MIRQRVNIERCAWTVHVYYSMDRRADVDDVLRRLSLMDCPDNVIERAEKILAPPMYDTGITFTNPTMRETVIVISRASSPAEFFNSVTHESRHLEAHISQALGLDPFGEEICYVAGEFAMNIFPIVRGFLCHGCQNHVSSS